MYRHLFAPIRLLSLLAFLLVFSCSLAAGESAPAHYPAESIYGYSETGKPLTCFYLGQDAAQHALLLVFGVHGFEDAYDHDGEVLRQIALRIIDHFQAQPQELKSFRLCVVPCANPDGLLDGTSHNGFGRCSAAGLDINRDFPDGWKYDYHTRNKTGAAPFSTAEARALRDLALQFKPTHAADVHGWINAVYGKGSMAECFSQTLDMPIKTIRSGGTLAQWLASVAGEAILIELPPDPNPEAYAALNSQKLIDAIRSLCASEPDS